MYNGRCDVKMVVKGKRMVKIEEWEDQGGLITKDDILSDDLPRHEFLFREQCILYRRHDDG